MEKHSVGQTIATLRKKKGWTQVELAEKLQVSDKAVSKWEVGETLPEVTML
jgi:transcriptional regulator with XRE-family HTH domain